MSSRLTVYIPVFSQSLEGKCFSATGQNPGVGGTQFTSVKLALLLADTYTDLDVQLVNTCEFFLDRERENLKVIIAPDLSEFFTSTKLDTSKAVILATMSILQQVDEELLLKKKHRVVAWQHHPFNLNARIARMGFRAHVSVGSYQYYSNRPFYSSLWHIQNPFSVGKPDHSPVASEENYVSRPRRLVYLGALIRGKGFLDIAKQWRSIKKAIPDVELHVIGSSATYGIQPEHDVLPCDCNLAEDILSYIPNKDIDNGLVVFHGNLDNEKYELMRYADAAILNPTGQTEAFPASPLECMASGLPVIASDKYGMSDSMSFFPELVIHNPEQIGDRLRWLFADSLKYEELRQRGFAVADWFDSQTGLILARWYRLFHLMTNSDKVITNDGPRVPLYGSRGRFYTKVAKVYLSHYRKYIKQLMQ